MLLELVKTEIHETIETHSQNIRGFSSPKTILKNHECKSDIQISARVAPVFVKSSMLNEVLYFH